MAEIDLAAVQANCLRNPPLVTGRADLVAQANSRRTGLVAAEGSPDRQAPRTVPLQVEVSGVDGMDPRDRLVIGEGRSEEATPRRRVNSATAGAAAWAEEVSEAEVVVASEEAVAVEAGVDGDAIRNA
jgi:hypothetical protein